ncbi:MAG: monovalent cation/H+ antiporter complex subunit F [bacterium]|nr:monovalent cation/H+ antiporter complex subunit F [bacterium]
MFAQVHGIVVYIFVSLLGLAVLLSSLRFILGPTASDRVVSTDILTTITTIVLVFLSLVFDRYIYLDVALVYAVLSFIAVVTIARYLEGGV